MNEQEAIDLVYDGLAGPESIPVKLRERAGLDRQLFQRVEAAILFLVTVYADRPVVPKRLVSVFIELPVAMQWHREGYSEAVQEEIEVVADRLIELAWQLFGEE